MITISAQTIREGALLYRQNLTLSPGKYFLIDGILKKGTFKRDIVAPNPIKVGKFDKFIDFNANPLQKDIRFKISKKIDDIEIRIFTSKLDAFCMRSYTLVKERQLKGTNP